MYTPGFIAPVMGDTYLKQHDAPEDIEYYLCGPPMMSKTVLDLLHSLGVEDDMIMFDDLWQLPQIKPPSVVGVQGLRYWIAWQRSDDNGIAYTHACVILYGHLCFCIRRKLGEKFLEMNISSLELSSEYPITKYAIPD